MPWNLSAFSQNVSNTALAAINPVADEIANSQGTKLLIGGTSLYGVYGIGVNLTRVQVTSPTIRALAPSEMEPIETAAAPTSPPAWVDMFERPMPLTFGEGFEAFTTSGLAAVQSAFIWYGTGVEAAPAGKIFSLRLTGTTALTALTWSTVVLTPDQSLAPGTYVVVGMRARSATGLAARLIPISGANRPGVICNQAIGSKTPERFRAGNAGVFMSFTERSIPSAEFFATAADAAETLVLDLIKTAGAAPGP